MIDIDFERRELLTDWQHGDHTLLVAVLVTIGDGEPTPVLLDIGSELCVISRFEAERDGWTALPCKPQAAEAELARHLERPPE